MNEIEKCYRLLDLEPGATLEEVNQAYKDLAFIWHPDRIPKDNPRLIEKAVAKLQAINHARDQLRSLGRKASTRNGYKRQPPTQPSPPPRRAESPKRPYYRDYRDTTDDRYRQQSTAYRDTTDDRSRQQSTAYRDKTARSRLQAAKHCLPRHNRVDDHSRQRSTAYQEKQPDPGFQQTKNQDKSTQPHSSNGHEVKKPYYSDLSGVDLKGANLKEKDLSGRNLSNADLRGADLSDSFLHKVVLKEADLSGANLFRANMLQADLRGANLQATNLIGADLSGADLSGANLKGAKIGSGDQNYGQTDGSKFVWGNFAGRQPL